MLSKLPSELLVMVFSNVTRIADLKNLCEVSRALYDFTLPFLYKSMIIPAALLSVHDGCSVITKIKPTHLVHIKELGIYGPFHEPQFREYCPLHNEFLDIQQREFVSSGVEADLSESFSRLISNLNFLISNIPKNQIQSFKWHLGACVPRELDKRIHVLLKNQRQITSISLITDRECSMDRQLSCAFHLAQFPKLQTLSWKGLKFYHDFDSVKAYIAAYGAQLKTLRLDLIGWDSARDIWTRQLSNITTHNFPAPENFFANTVFGLQQGEVNTPLPALQCLALSQVSFYSMEIEMIQALNMTGLHTLELSNCPGTFSWLREIVRSRTIVKLKSLELVFNPECMNLFVDESLDFIIESVTNFLRSFEGLQNLRLMLPQPTDWKIISKGISHHSSSIKTLITHNLNRTEFGGSVDGDLFFNVPDIQLLPQNKYLEFLGVSVSTQQLLAFPDCTTPIPNTKILHLRASGRVIHAESDYNSSLTVKKMECLNQFAKWAFSAKGYPELQVLAYGDFSYDNHYKQDNLLLRRVGYAYRELGSTDSWHWDLVRENVDALAACAYDELIVGRAIPTV